MKGQKSNSREFELRKSTIAYQNKDIISKLFSQKLSNKALEVYGIRIPRIIGTMSTNLPAVKANELRIDDIFLLEDGSVAILDYESSYKKRNKLKYMNYIVRVLQRHLEETGIYVKVRMIVIYTADVVAKTTESILDVGSLVLVIQQAFLSDIDSERVFQTIEQKIQERVELTEEEKMQLILYPLTFRGNKEKQNAIERAVNLVEKMEENNEDVTYILSGLLAFSDKVISSKVAEKIRRRIQMTKVGALIFNDGFESGYEAAAYAYINDSLQDGFSKEKIISKLQKVFNLDEVKAQRYYKEVVNNIE